MVARTVFNLEGLELGKFNRNLTYLYGLSDFWQFIFEDTEKIDLYLEASSQKLSDVYSKFLQLTSTISLADIAVNTHQQIKLVLLKDSDAVANKVNTFTLPEVVLGSRIIANRPFLPTAYLEADIHYRISEDGTQIQLFEPITSIGFPTRVLADGTKEFSFWFVDSLVDEQMVYEYYGKLLDVDPQTSTEGYKNFIYGLYFLFVNGPTLANIRKGLNLALGIPLARETETVLEIRKYLDTDQWLVITDLNSYLIPYGLEPDVAIGDVLYATQELGLWVEIKDYINDGDWWIDIAIPASLMPYIPPTEVTRFATAGSYADYVMRNFLKKHTFLVNVKTIDFKNIQTFEQLSDIIRQVKPTYTAPIYIWTVPSLVEDLNIDDSLLNFRRDLFPIEELSPPVERMVRNYGIRAMMESDKHADITVTGANTLTLNTSPGPHRSARANQGKTAESWYFEVLIKVKTTGSVSVGVGSATATLADGVGFSADTWGYVNTGIKWNNNISTGYGSTYTQGDLIGVSFDATADTITFYKNGVSQGQAFTGVTGTLYPMISLQTTVGTSIVTNFGQQAFTYDPTTLATNPGVYNKGTYVSRDTRQFTRDFISDFTNSQIGYSPLVNADPLIFETGIVDGYVNSVSQFRPNTREEIGNLRAMIWRNPDSAATSRSTMRFYRSDTPLLANEGVPVSTLPKADTQRAILLYSTTQEDLQLKYNTIGGALPGLGTWSWTLFTPYVTEFAINEGEINGTPPLFNGGDISLTNFNTFFFRPTYQYLGSFMPKLGYQKFTIAYTDLRTGDSLLFVRVYENTVGVYWLTSNMDITYSGARVVEEADPLAINSPDGTLTYGLGYYSSYYLLRSAGGSVSVTAGSSINDIEINGAETIGTASITRTYSDLQNPVPVVIDRSGVNLKFRRDFK